jgi:hypothetical protein
MTIGQEIGASLGVFALILFAFSVLYGPPEY